ncbi:rhodanese-like domain-containing protein [Hoyosella rhizosphaerae]|nr:rhodanese-like domain-containing protein [Hoyosella rhizosphaerae]MBN4927420.1 rhodanese-like domain-containing protein [Hoyosella rhizosphaerae]
MHSIPVTSVPDPAADRVVVVDVREQDEWDKGHAPGAVHIPMADIPARLDELDPDDELFIVCRSGGRSFRVIQWLNTVGYDATNVTGGMVAWQKAGRTVVDSAGAQGSIY